MLGRASKTELRARKKKRQDVSDISSWYDDDDDDQQLQVDVESTDRTVTEGAVGVDGAFPHGNGWDGGEEDTSVHDAVEMHDDDDEDAMLLQDTGAFIDAGAV